MEDSTKAAWIVHHSRKLMKVRAENSFPATQDAGKAGMLLSALAADDQDQHTTQQVHAYAQLIGIKIRHELPAILEMLRKQGVIDVGLGGVGVLGVSTPAVLSHTAEIYDNSNPEPVDHAAILLAELVADAPKKEHLVKQAVGDALKIADRDMDALLKNAREIGITDSAMDGKERLLFNGNLFRSDDPAKVLRILNSLTPTDQRRLRELEQLVDTHGCIHEPSAARILGSKLFEQVIAIGFYDSKTIGNSIEEERYLTRASALTKYGSDASADAFDHAKMLVAALTYGSQRSAASRGNIRMISVLLGSLVRGNQVGPATAIGEDYVALEKAGVVVLEPSEYEGRYYMTLRKKDVGRLALALLEGKPTATAEAALHGFRSGGTPHFTGPEERRIEVRRNISDERAVQKALEALRTGRGGL